MCHELIDIVSPELLPELLPELPVLVGIALLPLVSRTY